MSTSGKTKRNVFLTITVIFLLLIWGSFLLPNSLIYPIFTLQSTTPFFTIKDIYSLRPRGKFQSFIQVLYPDTETTYVFFNDEPCPFICPKNAIAKSKAEEIVQNIVKDKVGDSFLTHIGSNLYWCVVCYTAGGGHYFVNVDVITGNVEGMENENNH